MTRKYDILEVASMVVTWWIVLGGWRSVVASPCLSFAGSYINTSK